MKTWDASGKLQMTSERLTRVHSIYEITMGFYVSKTTHSQPVSGITNDGTWIVLPSISMLYYPNGALGGGTLSEIKIIIFTGSFYVETTLGYSKLHFTVLRI